MVTTVSGEVRDDDGVSPQDSAVGPLLGGDTSRPTRKQRGAKSSDKGGYWEARTVPMEPRCIISGEAKSFLPVADC